MYIIAICDNEITVCEILRKYLREGLKGTVCLSLFKDCSKLLELIDRGERHFDGIFIDISNAEGLAAMKKIIDRNPESALIPMTSSFESCEGIFDSKPCFFIKKPISKERVEKAVEILEKHLREKEQEKLYVRLNSTEGIFLIKGEIVYIESMGHKLRIHTMSDVYEIYERLDNLQDKLGSSFVRCHKSFLINVRYIKSMTASSMKLSTGKEILISRLKRKQVKEFFSESGDRFSAQE